MTEHLFTPKANREKMTQIAFEMFNNPAWMSKLPEVLAVYASGRFSAMSVGGGEETFTCVPVYEGLHTPVYLFSLLFIG